MVSAEVFVTTSHGTLKTQDCIEKSLDVESLYWEYCLRTYQLHYFIKLQYPNLFDLGLLGKCLSHSKTLTKVVFGYINILYFNSRDLNVIVPGPKFLIRKVKYQKVKPSIVNNFPRILCQKGIISILNLAEPSAKIFCFQRCFTLQ